MGLTTYTYNCPKGHTFETRWPFGRAPQFMMCGHCGNKEAKRNDTIHGGSK